MKEESFKNLKPGDLLQSGREMWLVLESPTVYEMSHKSELIVLVQVVSSKLYSIGYDDRVWVNSRAARGFKVISRSKN